MNDILPMDMIERMTGKVQYAAQRRWLMAHNWVFETDSVGRPVVDRGYYNMRMGLGPSGPAPVELDFSALYG
jgi:hypothetical protein